VQFISLEEDDKDLIVSFAIDDPDLGVSSLILHRMLFFEHVLDEGERGVKVSLEDDYFDQEDFNMLNSIKISDDKIWIKSTFREYHLDISMIENTELEDMVRLLKKQNHDNRFTLHII
jgi:hypothetical protein